MPGLDPRNRRAVIRGAVVLAVAGLAIGAPRGWARIQDLRAEVAEKVRLVEQAEAVARRDTMPAPTAEMPRLTPAATRTAVAGWMAANRLEPVRVDVMPTRARGLRPVVLRVTARGDLEAVTGFLRSAQESGLLVSVAELAITTADSGRGRSQRLDVDMLLEATNAAGLRTSVPEARAVLARNLFRADRRPPPRAFEPGAAPEVATPRPQFVVDGVVRGEAGSVLVRRTTGEPVRVLIIGDSIGAYRLVGIRRDSVEFAAGTDTFAFAIGGKS